MSEMKFIAISKTKCLPASWLKMTSSSDTDIMFQLCLPHSVEILSDGT